MFKSLALNLSNRVLAPTGLALKRQWETVEEPKFYDVPEWQRHIIAKAKPYTMTSTERLISLCQVVEHIVKHKIPGDIVECGVWRGGSSMAAAWTIRALGDNTRNLFLFDTYEGMTPADERDRHSNGQFASELIPE